MNDGYNVKVFTGKLIDLANQLRVNGEKKSDYQIVQKLLISLPAKFDSIVAVMEQTKNLQTLAVTELIGTLQAYETRVASRYENSTEGAFNVRSRGGRSEYKIENNKRHEHQGKGQKWCSFCKKNNHRDEDCWSKPKSEGKGKNVSNTKECYKCGKVGHLARECRTKGYEKAHISLEDDDEDHMLFSASEEKSTQTKEDVWLIDSGCTNHMTKEARYFTRVDRTINVPIKVGNREVIMTAGKGGIVVMTERGKRVIKDVFLVPKMETNVLSIPQIISMDIEWCLKTSNA